MRFSGLELRELLKAWFVVSLAFAIAMSNIGFSNLLTVFQPLFLIPFAVAGLTVGIAFLLHELSHKFLAQKYGCIAEFRSNGRMLVLSLFIALFGIVFVAPGGVIIRGKVSMEKFGKISSAGIITNLVLSLGFLVAWALYGLRLLYFGAYINAWLAFFNLLPLLPLDGLKVLLWNRRVYLLLGAISVSLLFTISFIGSL